MPIGGANVGWDEASPAIGDGLGSGYLAIESVKTAARTGLDSEHNWPSAGGANTGYHRYGSARPYYGLQSAVSSSGTDGRLMLTSDTSRLFAVGSGGTVLLGGASSILVHTFPGPVTRQAYWAEQVGVATGVAGLEPIVFLNSGFSGIPYITVSLYSALLSGSRGLESVLTAVSATGFTVASRLDTGVAASGHDIYWRSLGTRAL